MLHVASLGGNSAIKKASPRETGKNAYKEDALEEGTSPIRRHPQGKQGKTPIRRTLVEGNLSQKRA